MLDRHQLTSDLLADYALGFLSPEETSEVEAALALHPDARAEANLYLMGLSDMVMDLGPEAVPAGAEDRLMARLSAEVLNAGAVAQNPAGVHNLAVAQNLTVAPEPVTASPRRNWLYPLIGLAAAIGVGVAVLPGLNRTPDFAGYQAQKGAVTTAVRNKAGTTVATVVRLPGGHAYVQMQANVPAGRAYQAWKIADGKPVSIGMFKGRDYGAELPAGTVFAVTVEPEGGSPEPTTPPVFAQSI